MNNLNSSYIGLRHDLLKHITGENNIVLDVGCAIGRNGEYLLDKGFAAQVFGLEYDNQMAEKAVEKGIMVYEGDLNSLDFRKKLNTALPLFDYILFGDVLEHLYAPKEVLSSLAKKLKPEGKVIISLPNIAHIELFIQIYLKGRWPQNPRGIFDKTHLRWFTKQDALDLAENAGLAVISYTPKFRARDAIGSKFNWKLNLVKMINNEWVTFQHILICEHAK